jgi:diacylglycerol kinase family enzyme
MAAPAVVVLNAGAGGGRASRHWQEVEPEVHARLGNYVLITAVRPALGDDLRRFIRGGSRDFVAAGGDGTVNLLLEALIAATDESVLPCLRLGAVGLGSSNDFHKSGGAEPRVHGVPLKLERGGARLHDVGRLRYLDPQGTERVRHWIINASVGTTAEANRLFNHPNTLLRVLKRISPWRGIVYAAVREIVEYRSRPMVLSLDDGTPFKVSVKNLGIIKNPHFSGDLCYDTPYEPDSGDFFVHLLEQVSAPRLASTVWGLFHNRFTGQKGTRSWRARRVSVAGDQPFAIEFDGETIVARQATFELLPRLIQVCR